MQCIIVDDEAPARQELSYLLSKYQDIEIVAEADRASRAIELIRIHGPDVVFLDIQMPLGDGFTVIEDLAPQGHVPLFVFVTAFDSYAIKAFEAEAVDYLLKPIDEKRLDDTVQRLRNRLAQRDRYSLEKQVSRILGKIVPETSAKEVRIVIEKNGRMQLVDPEEVVYFDVEKGRLKAHLFNQSVPVHGVPSLDQLEKRLTSKAFFRAHRSVLVNLHHILEFSPWFNGKYNLVMNDKDRSELFVSRKRVRHFKELIGI